MNEAASILLVPDKMSEPPYQRTIQMVHVPKNSLMGCANDCRRLIRLDIR